MPQRVHTYSLRQAEFSFEKKKSLDFWMVFGWKSAELIELIFG